MMLNRSTAAVFVAFLCAAPARLEARPVQDALLIRSVRLFDGLAVHESRDVLITDGRIALVGAALDRPAGAEILDGDGLTLLPGLIDSHTHVLSVESLEQALVLGVTTELDMFMDWKVARAIRNAEQEEAYTATADLRSAGTLITAPGGHGTEYGMPIPTITEPAQAQEFVDARIEEGSDYIKIVYDTGESYGISYPSIDKATLAAVVAAAHARERMAVVHISTLQAARDAIEAGADGLVHMVFQEVDAEFVALVVRRNAFVIPTIGVLESASGVASGAALADDARFAPYVSPRDIINLKQAFPERDGAEGSFAGAKRGIGELHAAGVPLLAGTDVPNPGTAHGASIHRELELLVECGLSPVDALRAATSRPAAIFGLEDRGRIAPGLRADLLLVRGDPTTDITATRDIVGVWKQGVRVDRDAYREGLEREREGGSAPAGSEHGLVSDFESGDLGVSFGAGWSVSTDSFMGGKSTAKLTVVEGGAHDSEGSLLITGTIDETATQRWAGAMFAPGPAPMVPTDMSSKQSLSFWAKGDGQTFFVMLFLQEQGFIPVVQSFTPGADWKRFTFEFESFAGTDGSDLMGVYLGAGNTLGEFELSIDDFAFSD